MTKGEALRLLKEQRTAESLWSVIENFEGDEFFTASGLPFTYVLNRGKKGVTKELLIDRRKNSKSLSWSSILLAFGMVLKMEEENLAQRALMPGICNTSENEEREKSLPLLVMRPKALGDIRGISYIYSMFYAFGLINVPEKYKIHMNGQMVENA